MLQLFRTCERVCFSGQSLQVGDGDFFHRCRLALWGNVSVMALRANLKTCRAGRSDGQFLKTEYGIWSVGLGDDGLE